MKKLMMLIAAVIALEIGLSAAADGTAYAQSSVGNDFDAADGGCDPESDPRCP